MKNKALKHYKRKKFFYRFFMLKSPRQGTMFGLALMNMNIALSPFLVLMMDLIMMKRFVGQKRLGEIPWAEANQMPLYLVTPKDKLKEYVPNGKHSGKEINYGSI